VEPVLPPPRVAVQRSREVEDGVLRVELDARTLSRRASRPPARANVCAEAFNEPFRMERLLEGRLASPDAPRAPGGAPEAREDDLLELRGPSVGESLVDRWRRQAAGTRPLADHAPNVLQACVSRRAER
jgi:hypothetical protein